MTDQPTTQERCPTCDYPNGPWRCVDPWHQTEGPENVDPGKIGTISATAPHQSERLRDQPTILHTLAGSVCSECGTNQDHGYHAEGCSALNETTKAEKALAQIAEIQPKVLAMIQREGFKFETPLHLSESWEKLAFTLYSTICEIDSIARAALGEP